MHFMTFSVNGKNPIPHPKSAVRVGEAQIVSWRMVYFKVQYVWVTSAWTEST